MDDRIVITGVGPVSSIGVGREAFWSALLAGVEGIGPVTSFETDHFKVHRGGEVRDFRPEDYVRRLDAQQLGRTSQFVIAAARLALEDAGLEAEAIDGRRTGIVMGTTSGEPRELERLDDRLLAGEAGRVGPEFLARYPCHSIAAHAAREFSLRAACLVIPTACAAGNYAIAHACDLIRSGRTDLVLAGGADAFSRITYAGFARLGAIAPERCQPFAQGRKGMIPGEGAAILVLERGEEAARRGARAYAEVAGYGLTCDAFHMTGMQPEGEGAARAMVAAMSEAAISPGDLSYISAHGTGTPTNDRLETLAVKRAFRAAADRVPISSIKSMLGHTMGAASALEAAACALAVATNHIPPTIHLDAPDPECDLDYVPNRSRTLEVHHAMNNAYGFGGNNSSLILSKVGGRR